MNYLSKIVAVVVGTMLIIPSAVFAQEASATVTSDTTVTSSGTEGSTANETSTSGEVKSPRDAASGQSSGKRTFVVPHVLEKRENLQASTTLKREEAKERMEEKKENMQERREEAVKKVMEKRSEILKRHAQKMIERMKAAIERIAKLGGRLESRIAKLKEKGVDTSKSEVLLASAKVKLDEARAAVKNAEDSLGSVIASAQADIEAELSVGDLDGDGKMDHSAKDHGKPVREALAIAKDAVMDAHKALVEAIVSLRASAALRTEVKTETSATVTVQ